MKISFIIPFVSRSGAIRVIFEYANRLTERGHDVTVYYPFWPLNYKGKWTLSKFINILNKFVKKVKRLFLKEQTDSILFAECKFQLKQIPFINNFFIPDGDAIICSVWPAAFKINKLKKSKGKKIYFVQAHETFISAEKWIRKSFKLPLNIVCVSKYIQALLKVKYSKESDVILNGINFSTFYNEKKDFDKKDINISFINSGNTVKKVENILCILDKVKDKYPNVTFTSFGERNSSMLPSYVKYYENPDDDTIRGIYCDSDIFILSSQEEACPLSPAEAMACKNALITTPVGGVIEYSEHMKTAIHVQHDNPDSIFNALCLLVENNELRKELSMSGYRKVREMLLWDNAVTQFEKFIERSIG